MRIGLVVPHIFIHRDILPRVIFSPGKLAIQLAEGIQAAGAEITLLTAGPADTVVPNISADLSLFEKELDIRGDDYLDLLKKHPLTFISLARQVQAEIIAKAFDMANHDQFDMVHIYTNEEDIALPFARLCHKPIAFTHHDPFSFLIKYKNTFPKFKHLPWLSMSFAQRTDMPTDTNWLANIYHGLPIDELQPVQEPTRNYLAYLGRIIEPKGTHLAIAAVKQYNQSHPERKLRLKIAGKHYSGQGKDSYWQNRIEPLIDGDEIEYVGHISDSRDKERFLGNAKALIVPSTFKEPFGMVLIEALACGTPIIGLANGAIGEVIEHQKSGLVVTPSDEESKTITDLANAIHAINSINPIECRREFEAKYTLDRMCQDHLATYEKLIKQSPDLS